MVGTIDYMSPELLRRQYGAAPRAAPRKPSRAARARRAAAGSRGFPAPNPAPSRLSECPLHVRGVRTQAPRRTCGPPA